MSLNAKQRYLASMAPPTHFSWHPFMRPKADSFASPSVLRATTHLGHLIRTARLAREMTLKEVAVRVGTSTSTLTRIEKGSAAPAVGTVLGAMQMVGMLPLVAELRDLKTEDLMFRYLPSRGRSKGKIVDMDF